MAGLVAEQAGSGQYCISLQQQRLAVELALGLLHRANPTQCAYLPARCMQPLAEEWLFHVLMYPEQGGCCLFAANTRICNKLLSKSCISCCMSGRSACAQELALTQSCLQENPKSYSTWHHRKWLVLKGLTDLNSELKLVARLVIASDCPACRLTTAIDRNDSSLDNSGNAVHLANLWTFFGCSLLVSASA